MDDFQRRACSLGATAAAMAAIVFAPIPARAVASLTYRNLIVGATLPTLSASVMSHDMASGAVTINGVDSRRPTTPFRFDWGDGVLSQGGFPSSHTYPDRTRNYVVTITSTYPDGSADSTAVTVRFVASALGNRVIPPDIAVTLPATLPAITSTQSGLTVPSVQPVPDAVLQPHGRAAFERIMGAIALIQQDLVNDDLQRADGSFRQVVMLAPASSASFAFSVWYSQPVMFVAQADAFGVDPNWSTMAHEMGHNATLNSPAAFRLGGRIDGRANAIVSEALAQIFQHVTCHLLVNNASFFGIPEDLAVDVARRARGSFASMKSRGAGVRFASWNDPATPDDDTLPTFMTLAYEFFAAGDFDGVRYRMATKRLMYFLQRFNPSWQTRFSPAANSPAAETFRATMMVAAISYGVEQDLRARFRALGFPLDDSVFAELNATVGAFPADASRLVNLSVRSRAGAGDATLVVGFAVGGSGTKQVLVRGVGPTLEAFGVGGAMANPRLQLFDSLAVPVLENDDWGGTAFTSGAFGAAGAFAMSAASKDAAFLPTLRPGSYSAQVTSSGTDGIALVEAYDLDGLGGTARLTNLSARTQVGAGDNILIVGFAINGTSSRRLLIRAIGPGLAQFGVGGVLANPQLRLFSSGQLVESNDDWGGGGALAAAFAQVGAFSIPSGSRDSALIVTLPPWGYTAQVSGVGDTTGIGLVEVYELP